MSVEDLVRPEIRDLGAYEGAVQPAGALRLHANEAPERSNVLHRYPEVRPIELQSRLANRFGVAPDSLLATRGSSEAIDLLLRTFCRAGKDNIVISPPTFAMYRVYADIQGAGMIECPLRSEKNFAIDITALSAACRPTSKLMFICSPNNPTGGVTSRPEIVRLIESCTGKSVIVVDEAYIEFSDMPSMAELVERYDNLVVLRTLSKALALAGARCGAVIANPALIRLLSGVLPPYALATPVIECVLQALAPRQDAGAEQRIREIVAERARMGRQLEKSRFVRRVWPSHANFLLVRFRDLAAAERRLQAENILIRHCGDKYGLENCARITIGNPDENDRLLAALN